LAPLLVFGIFNLTSAQNSGTEDECERHSPDSKVLQYEGSCKDGVYHGFGIVSYADGGLYAGEWKLGLREGNGTMTFPEDNTEGRKKYVGEWKNDVINGFGVMEWLDENPYNVVSYAGFFINNKEEGYGVAVWKKGDIYNGTWKDGTYSGLGTFSWATGDIYTGDFNMNGSRTGYGVYTFTDGTIYEGEFSNGYFDGTGTMTWTDGGVYRGDFVKDERTGNGWYKFPSGKIYEGEFSEGRLNGTGIMFYVDGDVYEGDFLDGERTGYGFYTWSDGDTYKGEFMNGVMKGFGTYNYSDGKQYIGNFDNDLFNGNGSLHYTDGSFYEGIFKNDVFNGKGKMTWKDGEFYEGDFLNGERTGYGTYNFSDGRQYIGDFINGYRTGVGKLTWKNGNEFNGKFEKGNRNGEGTFTYKDGSSYRGKWKDDKLVKVTALSVEVSEGAMMTNNCSNLTEKTGKNVSIPWYIKSDNDTDMSVWPVWNEGFTGQGVVVSVVDDGVSRCHPSLKENFDTDASFDFSDNDNDPSPETFNDYQGTKGASLIAARRNEPVCTIGVAYKAKVGGIRMLQGAITDWKEAKSLGFRRDHIDIYQISWGPDDDGRTFDGPGPLTKFVLEEGTQRGRNGRGSVFILAGGTGGAKDDDCNADGYASSIFTMAISSVDMNNTRPEYSERCSAILAASYSGERRLGTGLPSAGISADSCSLHDGTSASASIATGIVALMLEAKPSLSWRDIQHIIALTSSSERLLNADKWQKNGAGLMVSHSFGFGLMDAQKMIETAVTWEPVKEQKVCTVGPKQTNDRQTVVSVNCPDIVQLEHVQLGLKVEAESLQRGDVLVELQSPMGTKSTLIHERKFDKKIGFDTGKWPMMSTHFWRETASGNWKILVRTGQESGRVDINYSLILYGTSV